MNHTCRRPPSLRSTSYQPQINKSSPLFDISSTDLLIPTKIGAIKVFTRSHAPVEIPAFRCSSLTRCTRLLIVLKRVTNQKAPHHPLTRGFDARFALPVYDPRTIVDVSPRSVQLTANISKLGKEKKKSGIIVWFYFHESRLSQAIEPLSWDPKPRLFQDLSLWATKLRFEPLSHDSTKPSRDLLQAKI